MLAGVVGFSDDFSILGDFSGAPAQAPSKTKVTIKSNLKINTHNPIHGSKMIID